jgi:hypothetical protein
MNAVTREQQIVNRLTFHWTVPFNAPNTSTSAACSLRATVRTSAAYRLSQRSISSRPRLRRAATVTLNSE